MADRQPGLGTDYECLLSLVDAANREPESAPGLSATQVRGAPTREACFPRKARPGCAKGADLLSNFAGLRVRSAKSGTARPAFVKTRYSGLTGHDDGQHGDDAGLAAGEEEVSGRTRGWALRSCWRGYGHGDPVIALLKPKTDNALPMADCDWLTEYLTGADRGILWSPGFSCLGPAFTDDGVVGSVACAGRSLARQGR